MALFAKESSHAEFEEFVERELPRLHRMAISLTGATPDAEDLVQDTLAKAYLHWSKVRTSGAPGAYVRAILSNSFLSSRRRRSSTEIVSTEMVDLNTDSADPTAESAQRQDLLAAVLRLPPNQRLVIVLRYLEDLPVPEVAKIVRKREGAVRAICHRALENLRGAAEDLPAAAPRRAARTVADQP